MLWNLSLEVIHVDLKIKDVSVLILMRIVKGSCLFWKDRLRENLGKIKILTKLKS